MKTLIIAGNPYGVYGRAFKYKLAKVWVDSEHAVHVEPLEPRYREFALDVQEDIDRRIANPEAYFYRRTGSSWTAKGGTRKSVTGFERAAPGDDNFLEVLRSDFRLTGGIEGRNIAGYEIWDAGSEIIEE